LKRRLDFKSLQVAQVSSYLLGYVALGIPAAYLGAGVWSLVSAQIAQRVLYTVQVFLRAKHSLRPLISVKVGGLAGFGWKVMGTNLLNWTIANADSGVVGKAFGSVTLGLYNRALVLVTVPVTNLMIVLQRVLFSAYSRAQDRRDALKRAYLASVGLIALLLGPLFVGVAAASSSVILGLYGEEWRAAVPILTPLALAMPLHAVMGLAGPLVWGTGRVEVELRIQGVVALVMGAVLLGLSGTSVVWVAWAVLGVYVLRCLMITGALARIAEIPPSSIARSLRGAFVASMLSGVLVWGLESWLRQSLVPPIARLAVDAVCVAAGYSLLLRAFPGLFFPVETSWALFRAAEASPPEFRRLIHRGLSWFGLPM
jgi:PST family polysaccharide transporter